MFKNWILLLVLKKWVLQSPCQICWNVSSYFPEFLPACACNLCLSLSDKQLSLSLDCEDLFSRPCIISVTLFWTAGFDNLPKVQTQVWQSTCLMSVENNSSWITPFSLLSSLRFTQPKKVGGFFLSLHSIDIKLFRISFVVKKIPNDLIKAQNLSLVFICYQPCNSPGLQSHVHLGNVGASVTLNRQSH